METILIIDDYPPLLRLYTKAFENEGYQVVAVNSLAKAIGCMDHYSFAAVIVEVTALLKEEFEALLRALNRDHRVPIIINTGERSRGAGAYGDQPIDAWVAKSSDLAPLKKVMEALRRKQPLSEFLCAACRFYEPGPDNRGACLLTGQTAWPKWVACGDFVLKTLSQALSTDDPDRTGHKQVSHKADS